MLSRDGAESGRLDLGERGIVFGELGWLNFGMFDKSRITDKFDLKLDSPSSYDHIYMMQPTMVAEVGVEK